MSTTTFPAASAPVQTGPGSLRWIRGPLILLALLVMARFGLEVAGVPHVTTRYASSSAALFLAAIYLGALAPLRGIRTFTKLILPAIVLAAWTGAWVILFTVISAVLRLPRSHFSGPGDYGNWAHLGRHLTGHLVEIGIYAVIVLILMSVPFLLRGWPVTVAPVAILGAIVVVRFWVEAMGVEPWRAAAWSSTVAVLLCGIYLGGVGSRLGLENLLGPALVIGWAWRLWVYLAMLVAALVPSVHTHFFDPSLGRVGIRLLQALLSGVVEGFIAGLIVWGIATWISRAVVPKEQ